MEKKDGEYKRYYENGQLEVICNYKNDEILYLFYIFNIFNMNKN